MTYSDWDRRHRNNGSSSNSDITDIDGEAATYGVGDLLVNPLPADGYYSRRFDWEAIGSTNERGLYFAGLKSSVDSGIWYDPSSSYAYSLRLWVRNQTTPTLHETTATGVGFKWDQLEVAVSDGSDQFASGTYTPKGYVLALGGDLRNALFGNFHEVLIITASDGSIGTANKSFICDPPPYADNGTVLSGTWTWDGTTTVLSDDTSGVSVTNPRSFIRQGTSGKWFRVVSVTTNVSVTIANNLGHTIPSGSGAYVADEDHYQRDSFHRIRLDVLPLNGGTLDRLEAYVANDGPGAYPDYKTVPVADADWTLVGRLDVDQADAGFRPWGSGAGSTGYYAEMSGDTTFSRKVYVDRFRVLRNAI